MYYELENMMQDVGRASTAENGLPSMQVCKLSATVEWQFWASCSVVVIGFLLFI